MSQDFELDAWGLIDFLASKGLRDRPDLRVQDAVAVWSDDERFERASPMLALAHLTYLLGISPLVRRPEDFPAHSLLGMSGAFAGWADKEAFLVLLGSAGGPFVTEWSPSVLEHLEEDGGPRGFRFIEALCDGVLADASRLIPAARAAASAAPAPE
jgi:hypothetical protein